MSKITKAANPVTKMFVLSEQELARMKDQQLREYVPEVRNLTLLQTEVEQLLNSNSGLSAEERLGLINRAQIRYENLKKQTTSPLTTSKETIVKPEDAVEVNEEQQDEHPDEAVIQTVQAKDRDKAIHIMNFINNYPDEIKYNPKTNHVSLNGKLMRTTNIKQLLAYLLVDTPKTHAPMGAASFMKALQTINFPKQLLFNRYLMQNKQEPHVHEHSNQGDHKDEEAEADQTGSGNSGKRKRKAIIRLATRKKPRIGISKKKKNFTNALRIY